MRRSRCGFDIYADLNENERQRYAALYQEEARTMTGAETLLRWSERVLTAASLDEVLGG
ncbi:MAG: hypothetical protein WBJ41_16665 [Chromatiaceae bacterium]